MGGGGSDDCGRGDERIGSMNWVLLVFWGWGLELGWDRPLRLLFYWVVESTQDDMAISNVFVSLVFENISTIVRRLSIHFKKKESCRRE